MDLLYSRYSSPMDLVKSYINRGRFGEFVTGFLREESERRETEAKKDNEWMLWVAYVHSYFEGSFDEWKKQALKPKSSTRTGGDASMTEKDIDRIMKKFFPNTYAKE